MIVFRNILNNYLIYINFKNVYYHLYKINIFLAKKEYRRGCARIKFPLIKAHRKAQCDLCEKTETKTKGNTVLSQYHSSRI